MLNMFLFHYFVMTILGAQEEVIEVTGGKLVIYTDFNINNLKISHRIKKDSTIESLVTIDKYDEGNFANRPFFYSINLPNLDKGILNFELLDNDKGSIYKIESNFRKKILKNRKSKYRGTIVFLTIPKSVNPDNDGDLFVEASYTYFRDNEEKKPILVIGENLDKKVNLDKSLELYSVKACASKGKSCIRTLKNIYSVLQILKRNLDPQEQHALLLNNFMYGLIYRITKFYSFIISYEKLYEGKMYEGHIICGSKSFSLFSEFIRRYETFLDKTNFDDKVLNESKKILTQNLSSDKKKEFLDSLRNVRTVIKEMEDIPKMFIQKYKLDEKNYQKRNSKYLATHKKNNEDNLNQQIKNLRKNLSKILKALFIQSQIKILNFIKEIKTNLDKNENNEEFKEECIEDIVKEVKIFFNIKSNLYSLFSDNPENWLKNLSEDNFFKDLSPENILQTLEEYKKFINECRNDTGSEDKYFVVILKSLLDQSNDLEKFWKKVKDENINVGLFTYKPTGSTKATDKKDSSEPIPEPQKNEGNWIKWIIILIILLIFLALFITIIMIKNAR